MKQFNNLRRLLICTTLATVALLASCTKVDDTLGGNLVPDNQQMKTGFVTLNGIKGGVLNPKQYVETRLYQTDSIVSSNLTYGYMGSEMNDTLGSRAAGFLSQYVSYYKVDSGYFGFRPIFDSAQIMLSISTYGADTLTEQTFAVYEITDNKYITEKPIASGKTERDTTFYLNFDPEKENMLGEKLFTFKLGGAAGTGPATAAVTMSPTAAGRKYIKRLMLDDAEIQNKYKEASPYSLYSTDSLESFINEFKGVYICPDSPTTTGGTIYSTSLEASGLSIYGRNHVESDPSLIQDTVGMVFYFYDSYAEYGNVSVNTVKHDYTQSRVHLFDLADAVETNDNRPTTPHVAIEGMGGIVTEMTFTPEFFADLEAEIEKENQSSGKDFKTLAFSQVRMSIYFGESLYDWTLIDPTNPGKLIDQMNSAPSRIGMYTDYKTLSPITDYAYVYEQSYSTSLTYSGYINRSRGCYVMDITGYAQQVWNAYTKEKDRAGSVAAMDWDKVNRKVYLAPEAYSLYTPSFTVLQGMRDDANTAPISFDLTYNMIK